MIKGEITIMSKLIAFILSSVFCASVAFGQFAAGTAIAVPQPGASDCAAKAIDKNGKPLSGAAKASFMKNCMADFKAAGGSGCAEKAIGKNGNPLAGAAKESFMKKCEADAKGGK